MLMIIEKMVFSKEIVQHSLLHPPGRDYCSMVIFTQGVGFFAINKVSEYVKIVRNTISVGGIFWVREGLLSRFCG